MNAASRERQALTGTMLYFMQSSYFQLSQMPSVHARMVSTGCWLAPSLEAAAAESFSMGGGRRASRLSSKISGRKVTP